MNDEAGPSGTQDSSGIEDAERQRLLDDGGNEDERSTEQNDATSERTKWKKLALRTRIHHLQHLLDGFDLVIFTQLAIVYYMDCSFLRFMFRCAIQAAYLMARPNMPDVAHSPLLNIVISNIICMFWHAFSKRPEAGEASRGYLHGGAMMDFIGQEGPISKLHLLLLDFVILALQTTMFTINVKERQLKKRLFPQTATASGNSAATATGEATSHHTSGMENDQDLDAEERGVMREDSPDREARDEELGPLDGTLAGVQGEESFEASLEMLRSGQVAVADLYVFSTIQEHLLDFQSGRSTTTGSSRGIAGITVRTGTRHIAVSMLGRRVGLEASLRGGESGG